MSPSGAPRLRAAIVTVSDRVAAGTAEDRGGARAAQLVAEAPGFEVAVRAVVPDEADQIRDLLIRLSQTCDLIVTTGGTGLSPRDVTPEATAEVIERRLPGFEEAMRAAGRAKTPLAILSRAVAGVRGGCVLLNLPGSPSAIGDGLGAVLPAIPHACAVVRRTVVDCAPARAEFANE